MIQSTPFAIVSKWRKIIWPKGLAKLLFTAYRQNRSFRAGANPQRLLLIYVIKFFSRAFAPIVGLSEVIVDIVESGQTLKENGLKVLEEITPLSARMVVNQVSMKMENERISEIINNLRKVIVK